MSLKTFQTHAKKEAKSVLDNAVASLEALDAVYKQTFPVDKLSEANKSFQDSNYLMENPVVVGAISASQDAIAQALTDIKTIHDFIVLHIPQMEDGNNFGVTVQLAAVKNLSETSEALQKSLDELPKYYSTRADAMDKLNLPSETESESKKEEKEGDTAKTTTTKEWKKSGGKQDAHRVQAVYAVDVQFYASAKKAFRAVHSAYIANLDFCLKNKDKLEMPKGSGGGGYSSMY
mmetsp:Transcript_4983/g.8635  ORF Transcript_4983/g.8635 Transcript_4983/m.8635 type:complete len:233 (-) Transcript_4983:65-763(-)